MSKTPPIQAQDGRAVFDRTPGGTLVEGELPSSSSPKALIEAEDDWQAVAHWLAEYAGSAQTQRAYRREAERLLLWLEERRLSLAQMTRAHLDEFEVFLADPRPREQWVGPVRPRQDPRWRPFRGPLSPASRRQSLVILQGMMAWLVEAGWLSRNPFRLMRDKRRRLNNGQRRVERYLERPLWDWLWAWLNEPLEPGADRRARFLWTRRRLVFGFAYLLAPRINEMSQARMEDLVRREGRWWWQVVGKGGKFAEIPVPPDMIELVREARTLYGEPADPAGDPAPLLRRLDGKTALGDNQLYRLIRTTFSQAAGCLEEQGGDPQAVARLRQATPHWLRHTALTHQAQAGVELRYLAQSARHSRLETTSRYLHTEDEEWHRQQSLHGLGQAEGPRWGQGKGGE
ncbi:site-specific integrase [Halomonas sp.]|uniref:tyrosine-type recombinase/integrase n=1 Tax=Halomonas sp. TaxID=1486246 RepID=UPI002580C6E5|nr:site-specific integrase [Halomonas sp.]MCJ8286110.1 site-specific integrase [Halomonas sp.]NQY71162.1 site-specific integrase [Halomonas sp.]